MSNKSSRSNVSKSSSSHKRHLVDTLVEENESLRASVVALRHDFESMLRHIASIEGGGDDGRGVAPACIDGQVQDDHDDDGGDENERDGNATHQSNSQSSGSILTDDNSRVSHCLRRIEHVKLRAMERLGEERDESSRRIAGGKEKSSDGGGGGGDGGGGSLRSYQECIDELLVENERLCKCVCACTLAVF